MMRNPAKIISLMASVFGVGAAVLAYPANALAHGEAPVSTDASGAASATEGMNTGFSATPYRAARLRVENIGYRIALANGDRCDCPEMMTGLILHDLASYNRGARPNVMVRFHLGNGFGVLDVVPGSSADRAGLQAGDELLGVDDVDLAAFQAERIGKEATSDRVELMAAMLQDRLRKGPVSLLVKRADGVTRLPLGGDAGCGGRIAYMPQGPVNAWSDGHYVAVTRAMIEFSRNDDELAFVVAHEMAHNLLHHAQMLSGTSPVLAMFGIGSRRVKRTEIAADSFAVDLMRRASFDPIRAEGLFRRTMLADILDMGLTHPMGARRIQIIEERMSHARADSDLVLSAPVLKLPLARDLEAVSRLQVNQLAIPAARSDPAPAPNGPASAQALPAMASI